MGVSAIKISRKKSVTVVAINGRMTIDRIAELRDGLLKAFKLGKNVQLSLAAVTEVDLTGLQLLCSSHRTAIAKDLDFSLTDADGDVLSSVTELAGMMRRTGCAQDINGTCVWKNDLK